MITPERVEEKRESVARRLTRECKHEGPGALRATGRIAACSCDCKLVWRTEWLAFEAGIPTKFWHFSPDQIDTNLEVFNDVIRPWVTPNNLRKVFKGDKPGYGLFLNGPNGTGKSTFLCWILMELIRTTQIPVYYTTTLRLISDHKLTFGSSEFHLKVRRRLDSMIERPILVIDELGKESYKDGDSFNRRELETILRNREERALPTLLASNMDFEAIARSPDQGGYGSTVASIIDGHMRVVPLEPGDRRVKLGIETMESIADG